MDVLRSPVLDDRDCVRHGYFTRRGGVSRGLYASLNCGPGSGDEPDRVRENRARVCRALKLDASRLCTLSQVHGTRVVRIEHPFAAGERPRADAMVTDRPGIGIGVLTADCVPVLLADARCGIVAAAHAGWRGALAGVVERTLEAMAALGAAVGDVAAGIGPAIAQASYEVGSEVRARFVEADERHGAHFLPSGREGHYRLDLAGFVAQRLVEAGVGAVDVIAADTRAEADRFFSYRRATLAGEPDYGRQVSVIALGPASRSARDA